MVINNLPSEIQQIKSQFSVSQILHHYGLKPKNNMLNCPFHEDKTASLQVNLAKPSLVRASRSYLKYKIVNIFVEMSRKYKFGAAAGAYFCCYERDAHTCGGLKLPNLHSLSLKQIRSAMVSRPLSNKKYYLYYLKIIET